MLRKPGSSTGTRTSRSRKAVKQTPEEIVRKLQRLPSNKKCADCSSKLPQVVNLKFGTFVCMACSGVHREFSHRVKGIGHSSFTEEEVEKLQSPKAGNEAVNAVYLARYDPNSVRERLRAPTDNNDLQLLRVWIRRKYVDKAWLDYGYNEEEEEKKEVNDEKKGKKKKSKPIENNGATIVSIPPKAAAPAAEVDLFGGWDTPKATSKPIHDPFSTMKPSTANNQANDPFVANFDSQSNTQKNEPFVADFDSQPHNNQQSDVFATNFSSNSTSTKTDPFVADFNSQPNNQSNDPFVADFSSQQSSKKKEPFVADFNSQSLNGNAKDDAFVADFSDMSNQTQQQQQQPPSFQANFEQNQAPNNESVPQMQGNSFSASFSQPDQPQPTQSNFNPSFENVPNNPEPSPSPAFGDFSAQNSQMMQQEPPQQMMEMETEAKRSDPFDAFSGLSVSDKGSSVSSIPSKPKAKSNYVKGQSIFYKERDGTKSQVVILKIHLDDDLEPFYTIKYPSGREKQTDDAHLTTSSDLEKVIENDTMGLHLATSNGHMPVNKTENEFSSLSNNINANTNVPSNNLQQQQQPLPVVPPIPTVQPMPVVQSVQHLGMDQMSQMIQNFSFQELLMMQQVITSKMQQIQMQQMQQHSKMMAMSVGMQQANVASNLSPGNQMNAIQKMNIPPASNGSMDGGEAPVPPPPDEIPPPLPPEVPPPPPPPVDNMATIEKKGNPFDSF